MDRELEMIRDEMEGTRASLADKIEALESQVLDTVQSATDTVSSTVEGVKDVVGSVTDTVSSVADTLNISKQVEEHPWLALGAAVATGFVAAQLLGPSKAEPAPAPPSTPYTPAPSRESWHEPRHEEKKEESFLGGAVGGALHTAVQGIEGLAIGTLMGVIRELANSVVPSDWKSEVTRLVDNMNTQLGGKHLDLSGLKEWATTEAAPGAAPAQPGGEHSVSPSQGVTTGPTRTDDAHTRTRRETRRGARQTV